MRTVGWADADDREVDVDERDMARRLRAADEERLALTVPMSRAAVGRGECGGQRKGCEGAAVGAQSGIGADGSDDRRTAGVLGGVAGSL